MPFKRLLGSVVDRIPGAKGLILADWEGEAVDQYSQMDDYELRVIGAHKGILLNHMRELAPQLDNSNPSEIIVTSEQFRTIILPVNAEYYVVLVTSRESCSSQAVHRLKECCDELRKEIE